MNRAFFHAFMWLMAALPGAMLLAGCQGRELCYDHSHVSPVAIEFDWSQAAEAKPNTMVVWFFSTTGNEHYRFELTDNGSASRAPFESHIKVRPGTYRVLCHNGTTDFNTEEGQTFDTYRIVTDRDEVLAPMNRNESAPLPDGAIGQQVKTSASPLYAHTLDRQVTIEPAAATEAHVRFTPVEMTSVYDVVITGVENLTPDVEASGVLTGLAEGWSPSADRPTGAEVTVPFELVHCGTDCLRGSLVVFGDNAPHDVRHYLRVYTSLKYFYDFDVTEAIHKALSAGNSRHIEIDVNGIKLPVTGAGMGPGVDDWENAEEINIEM